MVTRPVLAVQQSSSGAAANSADPLIIMEIHQILDELKELAFQAVRQVQLMSRPQQPTGMTEVLALAPSQAALPRSPPSAPGRRTPRPVPQNHVYYRFMTDNRRKCNVRVTNLPEAPQDDEDPEGATRRAADFFTQYGVPLGTIVAVWRIPICRSGASATTCPAANGDASLGPGAISRRARRRNTRRSRLAIARCASPAAAKLLLNLDELVYWNTSPSIRLRPDLTKRQLLKQEQRSGQQHLRSGAQAQQ